MLINVLSKLRRNISRINRNIMSETTQIIVDLSTNKSQEPSSESSDKKSKKPKYDKWIELPKWQGLYKLRIWKTLQ